MIIFRVAAPLRPIAPIAILASVALLCSPLRAQESQAGPAAGARLETAANARVVQGLSIQKTRDLDVGEVRVGTTGGLVRVDVLPGPSSDRSSSGGVALAGSSFSAAQFQVRGGSTPELQVMLPASATLSRIGGSETITVQDFRTAIAPSCSGPQCSGAPLVLWVGATLRIGADQAAGSYAGTFTVTVNEF